MSQSCGMDVACCDCGVVVSYRVLCTWMEASTLSRCSRTKRRSKKRMETILKIRSYAHKTSEECDDE